MNKKMTRKDAGNYKAKHSPDVKVDEKIARTVEKKKVDGKISCADAEKIAGEEHVTMSEVGVNLDLLGIKISKCQLGLFGYIPEKMAVKPARTVTDELERAINSALTNNRLPCIAAWNIAERFDISKMEVSSACEALKIKIKPCQLGAF
ncbi:MAG TPA: hypothetical protein VEF33_07490 [Syntrophales bacterium]|nr:hypothetical protein [Syntrophales bacterium]